MLGLASSRRLVQTIYAKAGKSVAFKINEPANFKPVSMASKKVRLTVVRPYP
jgi:hypothetical protein